MVPRLVNGRSPSYPAFVTNEPVAGNYFPVNSMIALDDGTVRFCAALSVLASTYPTSIASLLSFSLSR